MPEPAERPRLAARIPFPTLGFPAGARRDYACSAVVQWSTLAVGLLLFHLVARRGGVDGFAYYQIARGSVSTVQPLAMLGLSTGLQRYLPLAGARAHRLARRAFAVQLGMSALGMLAASAVTGPVGRLLGISGGVPAVLAIAVLLSGTCLCATAVATLRGTGQVAYANIASVLGLGVVPVLAFTTERRIESALILQGAGMAVVAVCGMVAARARPSAPTEPVPPTLAGLLRYGIRRTPGDIALPALFTLPTFAVAGAMPGQPDAGYVGFTTSAVTLICSVFALLTPVLLPRLSGRIGSRTADPSLHRGLLILPLVAAGFAALLAVLILWSAPGLVHTFLGAEFTGAVRVLRLGVLAAVPLAVYYAVRPSLDALHEAPVTTRLLLGCLTLQIVLTYVLQLWLSPATAAVTALCGAALVLGVSAYLSLARAMAQRPT